MRILWLSTSKSLYKSQFNNNDYNGVGWVGALQLEVMKYSCVELAIAYISNDKNDVWSEQEGVRYYPIYRRNNTLDKLSHYHIMHRKWNSDFNITNVKKIIDDFKPELIQSFGFECPLADIIGNTNIPVVTHIQGIINPLLNSYLPSGLSLSKVIRYGSWFREILVNNGFSFGYNYMKTLSHRERELFSKCKYVCGRTKWDYAIVSLMAPHARYFHVDELLRPAFLNAPLWNYKDKNKKVIISTISENLYKGLDLIAKTSNLLSSLTNLQYEWQIVGIHKHSSLINLFSKIYNIDIRNLPIRFMGVQSSDQIVNLLENADLYIHPSAIDNSPNSLCEAQLIGIPVIATNVGGISSLLPEGSGLLVPYNAPYLLCEKIIELLNMPEKMKEIGKNGHHVAADRHNTNKVINQLLEMYNQIIYDCNNGSREKNCVK